MRLSGKAALVTGGGTGIGRAIALALAREGAAVAVNYSRSRAAAEAVVAEIARAGGGAVALQADVAHDAEARRLVQASVEKLGHLDILVNNAGWTQRVPHDDLEGLTEAIWDRALGVNLKGPFFCVRAAVPAMRERGGGCVINIGTVAAFTGAGSSIAYAASKAGLTTMTRSLARALAPTIRVNAVAPGYVDTGFGNWPERLKEKVQQTTPLKRLATVEDVAAAALYLATDVALTGQVIVVDGGLTTLGAGA